MKADRTGLAAVCGVLLLTAPAGARQDAPQRIATEPIRPPVVRMAWQVSGAGQATARAQELERVVERVAEKLRRQGPADQAGSPALQGFSIVLVQGDLVGKISNDDLPQAAQRALTDMKDFLPYKGYALLDTAWMLGSGPMQDATTRMRGLAGQNLSAHLDASAGDTPGGVRVRFVLRSPAGGAARARELETRLQSSRVQTAMEQRRRLEVEHKAAAEKYGPKHAEVAMALERLNRSTMQLEALNRDLERLFAANREQRSTEQLETLIDANFTMRVGETVVVGTSRVGGDRALIALLTAVPSTASRR